MRSRFNRRLDMETRFEKARRKNLVWAKPGVHSCVLVLDGLKPDFNIGKIIRSADAFGMKEVHLINVVFFDPEPAKGSMKWVVLHNHDSFDSCYEVLVEKNYQFYCLEPEAQHTLGEPALPLKSAFVVGHEEFGISFDLNNFPAIQTLSIPQWGKVQSLNASVAASIAMYEYVRQHGSSV
ncbi:MAG: tRNA (guanine-N2)-dimethyltransferase [Desulfobacterales bacterium]|nr:MAG: tRNA (guanine-N2)-dimethyltransferase [Desulfobacterales bacterium]